MRRTLRITRFVTLLLISAFLFAGVVSAQEAIAEIAYLSRSTVYIDKGEKDGVTLGADLTVVRSSREIGRLAIEHVSMHSAACRIVSWVDSLKIGDQVLFQPVFKPEPEPEELKPVVAPVADPPVRPLVLPPKTREFDLSGRASVEWLHFSDGGNAEKDFDQPAVYLRLDGRNIKNRPLNFHLRMRNKYTNRASGIDRARPEREWRYRVYQAYLGYGDATTAWQLKLGRIYTERMRSVGSWDGLLATYALSERLSVGFFGGGEPDWETFDADFDNSKYGGYFSFAAGRRALNWYRGTVGFVGRYSDGDVNREYLVFMNEAAIGGRLQIRQNLELDFNRDWRKDATDEAQTLNRFNMMMSYRLNRQLSLTCDYDYYQNVRDLNNKEIPDSLFADAIQKGVKFGLRARLSSSLRIGGRVGFRAKSDQEKRPVYGNVDFSWTNIFSSSLRVNGSCAYADNRYSKSLVPMISISRYFGVRMYQGFGFATEKYEAVEQDNSDALTGQWVRWFGSYTMTERIDLNWQLSFVSGDIGEGERIYAGLTYRL
jgi:hypothetical protein